MNAECRNQDGKTQPAPGTPIGASPAFYLSLYGAEFRSRDILAALPRAAALGLTALQLEIYRPEALEEWSPAFRAELRAAYAAEGLAPSQFVAHYLLAGFADGASLVRKDYLEDYRRVLALAADIPGCPVLTVPVPAFEARPLGDRGAWAGLRGALVERLAAMAALAAEAGLELALELLPFSIVGGLEGFLRLRGEAGLENLRMNLDVGHAWARRERVEISPAQLAGSIAGTHLGDHDTRENRKLRPGAGSIDWDALVAALLESGYSGSLDLEIVCAPGEVEAEYRKGKARLEEALARARACAAPAASAR